MKAVVLAAGASSRFWPLASSHHKSFYKVAGGKTVIEYTVSGLLPKASEVVIVVSPRDLDRAKALFSSESKVKIEVLDTPSGGGNAILKAVTESEDLFFLTWSEKVFAGELFDLLSKENKAIAIRKTDSPQNFGIVSLDNGRVTGLIEKPEKGKEPTEFKVTAGYLLSGKIVPLLQKYTNDHYSLEKSLDEYCKTNEVKGVDVGEIEDTGLHFPWDLIDINHKLMTIEKTSFIHPSAKIADSAVLKPPYYIGENAIIGDFAIIRDCVYIDSGVTVGAHSEVKNSLVYEGSSLHRDYVGDSVIDSHSKLGAGVILANKRYDRGIVKSVVKGEKMETGLKALGSIIGEGANIGVNASIMPGVKVGNKAIIGPGKVQMEDVGDNETSK
jgi:bifunctional UDP-N-acetylglucosamine pyrophosphorylase/glucosamine-1-phosphate N-acetyltransferase